MKKIQYFFMIIICIHFTNNSMAQYIDSLWQVNNNTKQIPALQLFDPNFANDILPYISQSSDSIYEFNWMPKNVLEISFTNTLFPQNWSTIEFNTIHWIGDTTNKFTKDVAGTNVNHAIAEGYSINMTNPRNRKVSFEIQTDDTIMLLATLVDIQGKINNSKECNVTLTPIEGGIDLSDESKWVKVVMAWDNAISATSTTGNMYDDWSKKWWERSTFSQRKSRHSLDTSHIVGLHFTADPLNFGEENALKKFYIRNLAIGNFDYDNVWQVENETQNKTTIPLLSSFFNQSDISITSNINTISSSITNKILKIDFKNTLFPDNNGTVRIDLLKKKGTTNNYFTTDYIGVDIPHDTITGYSVDFSDPSNRLIRFEIQTSDDIYIGTELIDINDKKSNAENTQVLIQKTVGGVDIANQSKWKAVTIAWDPNIAALTNASIMADVQSTKWWNRNVLDYRDSIEMLDSTNIAGINLILDNKNLGALNANKTIYIRKLIIGKDVVSDIPHVALSSANQTKSINLSEYYLSSGSPTYSFTKKTGNNTDIKIQGSTLTITTKNLCSNYTDSITILVTDNLGVHTKDISVQFTKHTIVKPQIGLVSNDTTQNKTIIAWERETVAHIKNYTIYTISNNGTYVKLKDVLYADSSIYIQNHSAPIINSLSYAISSTDVCGIESPKSTTHKTLFLENVEFGKDLYLFWNLYENQDVKNYIVQAGNSDLDMQVVAILPATETSYTVSNPNKSRYRIDAVITKPIHPYIEKTNLGVMSFSSSNIFEYKTSIPKNEEVTYSVYPTITSDVITVTIPENKVSTSISIVSSNGEVVYTQENCSNYANIISVSSLKSGVYFVKILCDGVFGTQAIIKK